MAIDFSADALYNKSRVFVQRGIQARNSGDDAGFQFWASLSLELLGKAALAAIHPSLVADPSHLDSLLAAVGHSHGGAAVRSIMAKTLLLDRLPRVVKGFDKRATEFCMLLTARRNEELHSGAVPYIGVHIESWVPSYWLVSSTILLAYGKTLEDWLGTAEAKLARDVIATAMTALEQAVLGRIADRRAWFDTTYPAKSQRRGVIRDEVKRNWGIMEPFGRMVGDATQQQQCPACESVGALTGDEYDSEVYDTAPDYDTPPGRYINRQYESLAFRCRACGLPLDGRQEIEIADLPTEFEIQSEWEPDYEPDYGNE